MKKALTVLSMVLIAGAAMAVDSWQITLTTSSAVVAPDHNTKPTTAWDAGAVSAGDYVTNDVGRAYWVISTDGGTPTAEPVHRRGAVTGADGETFLALTGRRSDVTIQLTQAGVDVWFIEGGDDAVASENRLLIGKGMAWVFDDYSGEINAVTASGTATITVTEK